MQMGMQRSVVHDIHIHHDDAAAAGIHHLEAHKAEFHEYVKQAEAGQRVEFRNGENHRFELHKDQNTGQIVLSKPGEHRY